LSGGLLHTGHFVLDLVFGQGRRDRDDLAAAAGVGLGAGKGPGAQADDLRAALWDGAFAEQFAGIDGPGGDEVAVLYVQPGDVGDGARLQVNGQGRGQLAPARGSAEKDDVWFVLRGQLAQQGGVGFDAKVGQRGVVGQKDLVGPELDGLLRQPFDALAKDAGAHLAPGDAPRRADGFPRGVGDLAMVLFDPNPSVLYCHDLLS
jgi:hypothetical protein